MCFSYWFLSFNNLYPDDKVQTKYIDYWIIFSNIGKLVVLRGFYLCFYAKKKKKSVPLPNKFQECFLPWYPLSFY